MNVGITGVDKMSEILEEAVEKMKKRLGKYGEFTDFETAKNDLEEGVRRAYSKFSDVSYPEKVRAEAVLNMVKTATESKISELEKQANGAFQKGRITYDKFREEENPNLVNQLFAEIYLGIGSLKIVEKMIQDAAELEKYIGQITFPAVQPSTPAVGAIADATKLKDIVVDRRHHMTREVADVLYKMHTVEGKSQSRIHKELTEAGAKIALSTVGIYSSYTFDEARAKVSKKEKGLEKKPRLKVTDEIRNYLKDMWQAESPQPDTEWVASEEEIVLANRLAEEVKEKFGVSFSGSTVYYNAKYADDSDRRRHAREYLLGMSRMFKRKKRLEAEVTLALPEEQRLYLGNQYVAKEFIDSLLVSEEGQISRGDLKKNLKTVEGEKTDVYDAIKKIAEYIEGLGHKVRWGSHGVRWKKAKKVPVIEMKEGVVKVIPPEPPAFTDIAKTEVIFTPPMTRNIIELSQYRLPVDFNQKVVDEVDVLGETRIPNDTLFIAAKLCNQSLSFQDLKRLKDEYAKHLTQMGYNVNIRSDYMTVGKY